MWNQTEEKRCERQRVYLQVLQLIRERGAISRVEIASALQMTRGAVSLLIQEMLEKGFLEDVGAAPTAEGKGRRKMLLDIHPCIRRCKSYHSGIDHVGVEYVGKTVDSL